MGFRRERLVHCNGGLGPSYEQAIQITAVEIVRTLIDDKYDPTRWDEDDTRRADMSRLTEKILNLPVVQNLGLSGGQWDGALSLATCLYRRGPVAVLTDKALEDRAIQIHRDFPGME